MITTNYYTCIRDQFLNVNDSSDSEYVCYKTEKRNQKGKITNKINKMTPERYGKLLFNGISLSLSLVIVKQQNNVYRVKSSV